MTDGGVYYNEIDPFCAAWLRELMKADQIPDGEIDTRSIVDVQPDDLRGFTQCHFFAGIGGWAYALRLAGWGEREVWTGSCPCQPWSMAGSGEGTNDPRDLWPTWFGLIEQCRPSTVLGEQVASTDGRYWLDRVYVDMEGAGYAVGAANLPACSVGAPHRRERLYLVADLSGGRAEPVSAKRQVSVPDGDWRGETRLADRDGCHGFWWSGPVQVGWNAIEAEIKRGSRRYRAQWRIKPGVPLLAHGVSGRVGRISGFGNAIVPQVAQVFIEAVMDCLVVPAGVSAAKETR